MNQATERDAKYQAIMRNLVRRYITQVQMIIRVFVMIQIGIISYAKWYLIDIFIRLKKRNYAQSPYAE